MAVFHGHRKLAEYSVEGKEAGATNETDAARKAT
jgi:hypothetical protein